MFNHDEVRNKDCRQSSDSTHSIVMLEAQRASNCGADKVLQSLQRREEKLRQVKSKRCSVLTDRFDACSGSCRAALVDK